MIAQLTHSRKFIATALSVVIIAVMVGLLDTDLSTALAVIAPLQVYTVSQGLADQGKEAAMVGMLPEIERRLEELNQ